MTISKCEAPWNAQQVASLNLCQHIDHLHPYTCGDCGTKLVAVAEGWICPSKQCCYHQSWAHADDADGKWPDNPLKPRVP